jgi:hypothetical protein
MSRTFWGGLLYVNIHTPEFPAGEIRGQIVPSTSETYSIAGHVGDTNGAPLANVTVVVDGGLNAQTDSNGNYSVAGLEARTYTVVPAKTNYSFTPRSRVVSVPPNATNENFVGTATQLGSRRAYIPIAILKTCDDYEPNDNRFTNPSGPLLSGQPIQAKLCSKDIEDNYYFVTQTNNQIQIKLSLPPSLVHQISVWVYAQNDLQRFHEICKQGSVEKASYIMPCSIPSPGAYVIRMYTDGEADDVNPYILEVNYQ